MTLTVDHRSTGYDLSAPLGVAQGPGHVLRPARAAVGVPLSGGAGQPLPIPVWVRSLNQSSVNAYLLCGDRDARWLGMVQGKDGGMLEIPAPSARCVQGLNFFLVHRDLGRDYWVGPIRPQRGSTV